MSEALQQPVGVPDFTAGIRILARLARIAEQSCQATGISLPQYRLLLSASGQAQRASELAARVGVSRPTLTSLVDGLEQAGLLRRRPVATDRRGIQLVPTQEGLDAVSRAEEALTRRMLCLVEPGTALLAADVVKELGASLDREREAQVGVAR
jgi:DNA-binding MarR family transcriptional regulator